MTEKYTLITGGSMGIGRAFAFECAKKGHNLLLVALPEEELDETVNDIKDVFKDVKIDKLCIDLTALDAPEIVFQWCKNNHYKVDFLINNAGLAGTSVFEKSSIEYSDTRIMLNIRALVLLTRYFLPMLRENEKAYILNIGSLSAYYSIPFKAVYSASKGFVVQFTKALETELKNSNISITVVCPNGVLTNEGSYKRINSHGYLARQTIISANELATRTIEQVYRNKLVYIPKRINRILLILQKIIPSKIQQSILLRSFEKEVRVS